MTDTRVIGPQHIIVSQAVAVCSQIDTNTFDRTAGTGSRLAGPHLAFGHMDQSNGSLNLVSTGTANGHIRCSQHAVGGNYIRCAARFETTETASAAGTTANIEIRC